MPALAPISIADGAATPVTHIFSPVTTDGQLALLQEKVGVPKGFPSLTLSLRQPVNGNGLYRAKIQLAVPVTGVDAAGSTIVRYSTTATLDIVLPDQSSQQERKNIRVLISNLLKDASVVALLESPEPIW